MQLTEAAREKIRALARADGRPGAGLRITVEPGGCCGTFYYMSVDVARAGDEVITVSGAWLLLARDDALRMAGARLDYRAGLKPPRFRVHNPGSPYRCPCGRSFGAPWAGKSPGCRAYEPPPWLDQQEGTLGDRAAEILAAPQRLPEQAQNLLEQEPPAARELARHDDVFFIGRASCEPVTPEQR